MKSAKSMQLIQPKLQELQKKYKNDKEKLNMAVMDLYKNIMLINGRLFTSLIKFQFFLLYLEP